MTYLVTDACMNCEYQDYIEVCPVDYFYEGENIIGINTEERIDCAVCEPECPVDGIVPDTDPNAEKWIVLNQKYGVTLAKKVYLQAMQTIGLISQINYLYSLKILSSVKKDIL